MFSLQHYDLTLHIIHRFPRRKGIGLILNMFPFPNPIVEVQSGVLHYLMLDISLLAFVKMNFEQSRTIELDTYPLADDFSGINEILQDIVVHCG